MLFVALVAALPNNCAGYRVAVTPAFHMGDKPSGFGQSASYGWAERA
jgi:hypothetical protein